jgi:hypothetical protein
MKQGSCKSVSSYHDRFKGQAEVILGQWGDFYPPKLAAGTSDTDEKQSSDKLPDPRISANNYCNISKASRFPCYLISSYGHLTFVLVWAFASIVLEARHEGTLSRLRFWVCLPKQNGMLT